ncbi:CIR protein [Plasmodium chabaudi adami]|uniref:CIR protein n=1 Tax=Plasmodium chabaudi adami TaxID=5826 RepID=A0A1C6WC39_PLACE|nr:CIR protein [Plasmodium chabaudi adami]
MTTYGMCETFLEADKIINGENGARMKMEDIRKSQSFNGFCPNNKCVTDEQCIGAMTMYVFSKVGADKNNEYGEYFLMWLSDKLFKMHEEGKKKSQSNITTLDEAYKSYLDKNIGNNKYWDALDNVKGLKDANLSHMNEFYKLLKHICKTIMHHKNKPTESENILQNSTNSYNQYMLLYQNVSECDSYLHLLDNLKKTYEKFRSTIKNGDSNLASSLQTLTTIENTDSYFVKGFSTFDFSNSKCQSEYDDEILEKWRKDPNRTKQKDNGANEGNIKQNSQPQSSVAQTPSPPVETGTSSSIPDNGADTLESKDKVVGDIQSKENSKGSETTGICDIYVPKEYKQTRILIIVILIPITLAIMYKYLSFGRRNELKRKKNMKKVINLMEGKRHMEIIIKSSSQKKQTKKSINPVYGEKSPSINIYKLMQADPVPFINLIFLLIFLFIKEKTILWKDIFN